MKFIEWYKEIFEKLKEAPPTEVWHHVSEQLDIDDVWLGVKKDIANKKRRKLLYRGFSMSLILLLITGASVFIHIKFSSYPFSTPVYNKSASITNINKVKLPIPESDNKNLSKTKMPIHDLNDKMVGNQITSGIKEAFDEKTKKREKIVASMKLPSSGNATKYLSATGTGKVSVFSIEEKEMQISKDSSQTDTRIPAIVEIPEIMPVISILIPQENTSNKDSLSNVFQEIIGTKDNYNPNFIIGGTATYVNHWLINNKTVNGLGSKSLNQSNATFGVGYGLSLGYAWKPGFAMETSLFFHSEKNQQYHFYEEGIYQSEIIALNYSQFNLAAIFNSTERKKKWNVGMRNIFYTGIYIARVKNTEASTLFRYSKNDFGVNIGIGKQIGLGNGWVISPSIYSEIGLKNIYIGDLIEPRNFDRTYHFSMGMRLSLAYLINKN